MRPLITWKMYDNPFLNKFKKNILCFYFEGLKLNLFMLYCNIFLCTLFLHSNKQ